MSPRYQLFTRRPGARRSATLLLAAACVVAVATGCPDPTKPKVCKVTVLSVGPAAQSMVAGTTQQYSAGINATDCSPVPSLTWNSSATNVASVSISGLVTALAPGFTTISASSATSTAQAQLTVTQLPVASVEITPAALTLEHGASPGQLLAVTRDQQGNVLAGRTVTWQSLTPAVATVSSNGPVAQVTTVGVGEAIIQASSEGRTALSRVTVTLSRVTSVTVTLPSASIVVGQNMLAQLVLRDLSGATVTRPTVWSSSNPAVASVLSTNGSITGVAPGTSVITAISEGVSGQATVTVTLAPAASVTVTVPPALNVGSTGQSTVVVRDAQNNVLTGRSVTWSSTNVGVATVHATSGLVTAIGAGTTTIRAQVEGVSGQGQLTVSQVPVAVVSVSLIASSLLPGLVTTATAVARDAQNNVLTGRTVAWSSSNAAVANVHATTGVVVAVAMGTANIQAVIDGVSGQAQIVVGAPPVAAVSVTLGSSSLAPGQTTTAAAVTRDAQNLVLQGRVIAWTSSAPNIATVHPTTGLVTAVAPGTVQISATSEGKSGVATLTVSQVAVGNVSVTIDRSGIAVGETAQATATVRDGQGNLLSGRTVTWQSASPGIASVQSSGLVTAVAPGTTQIQATVDGVSGSVALTVAQLPVASVSVTLSAPSANPGQQVTATVTARDANGNVLTGRQAVWRSQAAGVALVLPATAAWSRCGNETQTCQFPFSQLLARFGNNNIFTYAEASESMSCTSGAFGIDPITGLGKFCDLASFAKTTTGGAAATVTTIRPGTTTVSVDVGGKTASVPLTVLANVPLGWATISAAGTKLSNVSFSGGTITSFRAGTGQYVVEFNGMGPGVLGTSFFAHVSAESPVSAAIALNPPNYCELRELAKLTATGKVSVNVMCFGPNLTSIDQAFRVTVVGDNALGGWNAPNQRSAFMYGPANGALSPAQAWNSWGGTMTSSNPSPGAGVLTHGALFQDPFQVFLSSASDDPSDTCVLELIGPLNAAVLCTKATGIPASNFKVGALFFQGGRPGQQYAFARIVGSTIGNIQSSNPFGATVVNRHGPGRYTITFNGTTATYDPAILLTAWIAPDPWSRCAHSIQGFSPVRIDVLCWNRFGQFIETGFSLAFMN